MQLSSLFVDFFRKGFHVNLMFFFCNSYFFIVSLIITCIDIIVAKNDYDIKANGWLILV